MSPLLVPMAAAWYYLPETPNFSLVPCRAPLVNAGHVAADFEAPPATGAGRTSLRSPTAA